MTVIDVTVSSSGADLESLVDEAAELAYKEFKRSAHVVPGAPFFVRQQHFDEALKELHPSVSTKVIVPTSSVSRGFPMHLPLTPPPRVGLEIVYIMSNRMLLFVYRISESTRD